MPPPDVIFENKRFALGGYFNSGNIDESKEKVEKHGGIIQAIPNGKTDYIVVNIDHGVNGTYENAIKNLRERGIEPVIISEEHWLSFIKT
jgi:NAD-dependent DNA ligase